ncbi:centrosomal protein of 76 kDa isoform X3 [Amblyraja radiata]|uniref:centrosomal protein of 76 kDa isoform X3 n=1 Tax=Amblyraja radiata TaxID=386614 RepID=UPI0014024830|nr:centrosomal protein of 76 kDa isoform X3 [Amblyraja radiata]
MALPPEKASELKQIIRNQLSQMNIHGKIRDILSESVREELGKNSQGLSEADLIQALQRRGIVDDVMKELNFLTEVQDKEATTSSKPATHFVDKEPAELKKTKIDPTRRNLYLQVLGGRAFLEHLQEPLPLPGQVCATFTLYLHFRNQRFRSKPAACACEPDLQDGFLLEVHKDSLGDGSRMADATTLLSICDPVHMVLIKTDTSSEKTLIASHYLEWRSVLSSPDGKMSISVELLGVGTESKVPVGVLNLKLEIYPHLTQPLSKEIVDTQLILERQKTAEKERLYLIYAKQWWREYLQIRPSHNTRLVKIFAQGDCEDHATLLCSLLLGFGLDAYVCVGTKARRVPHTWVMAHGTSGDVVFWESLTGHRYIHRPVNPDDPPLVEQPKRAYPYCSIGCLFNHQSFYANCQPSDTVELSHFDLNDESKWKPMSTEAIKSVCAPGSSTSLPPFPPLCAPVIDAAAASNEIELVLRGLISEHRKDLSLATVWDDHLSYLLSPALAAYEIERTTGVSTGNEEFQDAIKRAVPDGHTFKGFPIHFVHRNPRRAFATCLRSPFCDEIICCRGDQVRLAVRVRVYPYPESACAVWIMFACKYRSVL